MGYLLTINNVPIEYRSAAPDDPTGWEEVQPDDPRIAQIGANAPQWGAFRMGVLNRETLPGQQFHAALAAFMAVDPISTNALMTEAGKDAPYVAYLCSIWNLLVAAAEYVPPEGAVAAWNAIAQATNVSPNAARSTPGLEWLPNGRLRVDAEE